MPEQTCGCGHWMRLEEVIDGLDCWYCPACGMDRVTDSNGTRVRATGEEARVGIFGGAA